MNIRFTTSLALQRLTHWLAPLLHSAPRLSLLLALWLSVSACESEPPKHEFMIQAVGGPEGWPVWVETLTFDDTWSGPNGDFHDGFGQHPPASDTYYNVGAPFAAPQSLQARWFSYRTQTFYEIDLELPDTTESLQQWYRQYPISKYNHALTVGLSGQGEAQVGWHAWCRICPDQKQNFYALIVASAYGERAESEDDESNLLRYRTRTQGYIDEGTIPSPW